MRLIDADALEPMECGIDEMTFLAVDFDDIKNAPTIDAEPVRYGEWVEFQKYNFECSECGKHVTKPSMALDNFCPNCGAKMDGGVE